MMLRNRFFKQKNSAPTLEEMIIADLLTKNEDRTRYLVRALSRNYGEPFCNRILIQLTTINDNLKKDLNETMSRIRHSIYMREKHILIAQKLRLESKIDAYSQLGNLIEEEKNFTKRDNNLLIDL